MPFHELGKHGIGVFPAVAQDQQSGHEYVRSAHHSDSLHRLPQPILGFVPIVLSPGDQQTRQLDTCMHIVGNNLSISRNVESRASRWP